jgi:hypothetical protein
MIYYVEPYPPEPNIIQKIFSFKSMFRLLLIKFIGDRIAPELTKKFLSIDAFKTAFSLKTLKTIFSPDNIKQFLSLESGFKFKQVPILDGIFYDSQSECQDMKINPIMQFGIPAAIIGTIVSLTKMSESHSGVLHAGEFDQEMSHQILKNIIMPMGVCLGAKNILENL